ncbi:extracellular solute-binding protein [Treponema vincentii]|nr:extracellular solute-binding protein [Treponema vincentii]
MGLFYRKDYFEQAGVKASDIVTWSDFIVAGKKK